LQRFITKVLNTATAMCRQDRLWRMLWDHPSRHMDAAPAPAVDDQRGMTVPGDSEMNASGAGFFVPGRSDGGTVGRGKLLKPPLVF
jgi:hypothetical protein